MGCPITSSRRYPVMSQKAFFSTKAVEAYTRALEARNLASIIGAEELSGRDRRYLSFAEAFEKRFVGQDEDDDRSIIETLDNAWDLLSILPPEALSRVTEADLGKYHKWEGGSTE